MQYLVLRTCYRQERLYKEGKVWELPEEFAGKHPKDFRAIGQTAEEAAAVLNAELEKHRIEQEKAIDATKPKKPESSSMVVNPLACRECGKICKSEFGLRSHMRVHK